MGTVTQFPHRPASSAQVVFDRFEISRIVDLYGRMVAAGLWKDYAIEFGRDSAAFWAFRRSAERPEYKIEKRPALGGRHGMWALIGEHGAVMRRGHQLGPVLAPIERRLMKLVGS
ncbi:MAG TPA: DUF2794 domain-containing protein [Allosphingosinicella sp.]|nr:DUF2794 domain-containing protein [Allosphingosinicella sp.]